jgi:hypothetical protein
MKLVGQTSYIQHTKIKKETSVCFNFAVYLLPVFRYHLRKWEREIKANIEWK